eukprot:CAMPEP_0197062304 /NCGR_PEP_ID=MMETSP1384-20130603/143636_1 /TAXON_ID=29189 /ORGANISM="Ammonia sp." /LENGTH=63 /DNA_ID=CAMNT_0042498233 /DNA_START=186 /DNA_END=377 /DNA_ORIENTATION=+
MTIRQREEELPWFEWEGELFFEHKVHDGCHACEEEGDCSEYQKEYSSMRAKWENMVWRGQWYK